MLNELERMAVNECIQKANKIHSLSTKLMGNNRKELTDHIIQNTVLEISSLSEQIRAWQQALTTNNCNCGSGAD